MFVKFLALFIVRMLQYYSCVWWCSD